MLSEIGASSSTKDRKKDMIAALRLSAMLTASQPLQALHRVSRNDFVQFEILGALKFVFSVHFIFLCVNNITMLPVCRPLHSPFNFRISISNKVHPRTSEV